MTIQKIKNRVKRQEREIKRLEKDEVFDPKIWLIQIICSTLLLSQILPLSRNGVIDWVIIGLWFAASVSFNVLSALGDDYDRQEGFDRIVRNVVFLKKERENPREVLSIKESLAQDTLFTNIDFVLFAIATFLTTKNIELSSVWVIEYAMITSVTLIFYVRYVDEE